MARLPQPGGDAGSWGNLLNDFLAQSHNIDGTIKSGAINTTSITNDAITEAKLDSATRTKLNATAGTTDLGNTPSATSVALISSSGTGTTLAAATTTNAGVLSSADKVKLNGIATGATANSTDATLLNRTNHTGTQAISTVTGLQTALDGKAALSHTHTTSNITDFTEATQDVIGASVVAGANVTVNYNDTTGLTTVSAAGGGGGATLADGNYGDVAVSGTGTVMTVASGAITSAKIADGTITDGDINASAAIAQSKVASLTTDLAGKASTATTVTGASSITGGGSLAANRTLTLVNDSATPGNSKYYGTDGGGAKGFFNLPAGAADPTVGGDLSGTASNAQIVANAVGSAELAANAVTTAKILDVNVTGAKIADNTITEPKLAISNSPSNSQVLSWNGSALAWAAPSGGAGSPGGEWTYRSITADTTAVAGETLLADSTSGAITITLPAPAANAAVRVKRLNTAGNGIQIQAAGGAYIDALAVGTVTMNSAYAVGVVISDGTNWYRV